MRFLFCTKIGITFKSPNKKGKFNLDKHIFFDKYKSHWIVLKYEKLLQVVFKIHFFAFK